METTKEINIKNRTYYFYNDITDLDVSKIKVDKKDFNDIDIYYLGYEHKKKISECNVINSVNPLYLTLFMMGGAKSPPPPTSFSPVTSTNVGFGPKNFLTFSFNPLSH